MARFLVVDDDPSTVKAMTLLLSARSVSHDIAEHDAHVVPLRRK
jgi:hypothetical protein